MGRPLLTLVVSILVFSAGCHLIFRYEDRAPDAGATDLAIKKDGKVNKDIPKTTKDLPKVNKDGPFVKKDGLVVKKDGHVVKKDGPAVKKDGLMVKLDKGLNPDAGPGPCAAGQTRCNGSCVDTSTNLDHCGWCNNSCKDGLSCTTDSCGGTAKGCVNKVASGKCAIDGACYNTNFTTSCLKCDASQSQTSWSPTTVAGCVYTLAGEKGLGDVNGTRDIAQFKRPYAIAVHSSGIVYISDSVTHKIRKIVGNNVTTLAGGLMGHKDATGTNAQFNTPKGLALDSSGNLYVADSDNHRIRKITPTGEVTSVGPKGTLKYPEGLTVTATGDVYIADTANHVIRKLTQGGTFSLVAGKVGEPDFKQGLGTATARFHDPTDVSVGHGTGAAGTVLHLVVVELGNHCLRRVTINASGTSAVVLLAGSGVLGSDDGSPPTAAKFRNPYGMAGVLLDSNGDLQGANGFVVDTHNNAIRSVNKSKVGVAAGVKGNGTSSIGNNDAPALTAKFNRPYKAARLGKQIFITDYFNSSVRVLVLQ